MVTEMTNVGYKEGVRFGKDMTGPASKFTTIII